MWEIALTNDLSQDKCGQCEKEEVGKLKATVRELDRETDRQRDS